MRHNAKLSNVRGFSLIELSIALIILGLVAVPLMQIYKTYRIQKAIEDTYANSTIIQTALGDYYLKNGIYPVPSDRTLNINSANYGRAYTGAIPAAGNCIAGNGVCVGAGSAFQADTVTPITKPNVLIGAVPFAELGIPPEDALDGWGRKLVYAVTQNQTEKNPPIPGAVFDRNAGTILMNTFKVTDYLAGVATYIPADDNDGNIPKLYTNFHIIILSLGEDGAGAYNQNGTLYAPCVAGRADSEDCDDDGTFFNPIHADLGNDQTAGMGKAGGAFHYDDLMTEISDIPTGMWSYSQTDNKDITTFRRVAIGTTDQGIELNPDGSAVAGSTNFDDTIVLDVGGYDPVNNPNGGKLAATTAGTSQICDVTGGNCFQPEALGGDDTSNHITCGAATADGAPPMTGIAQAAGLCDYQLPVPANQACAPGHEVIGFNAGIIQCN